MNTCTHPGPCKQLVATGKRGPAFEPWRPAAVWIEHRREIDKGTLVKSVRFVAGGRP